MDATSKIRSALGLPVYDEEYEKRTGIRNDTPDVLKGYERNPYFYDVLRLFMENPRLASQVRDFNFVKDLKDDRGLYAGGLIDPYTMKMSIAPLTHKSVTSSTAHELGHILSSNSSRWGGEETLAYSLEHDLANHQKPNMKEYYSLIEAMQNKNPKYFNQAEERVALLNKMLDDSRSQFNFAKDGKPTPKWESNKPKKKSAMGR